MNRYLVSFCNAGEIRLAILTRAGIERDITIQDPSIAEHSGVTGIAISGDRIFLALNSIPSAIMVLDRDLKVVDIRVVPELFDLHGVACDGNRVIVVSTGTNQVCALPMDLKGNLDVIWHGDVLNDTIHINSVQIAGGTTFLSLFGPRRPGQMRHGEVIDLTTGLPLLSGLREPHSPVWWNDSLYILESATGDLLQARKGFAPRRLAGMIGYARGLAVDEEGLVFGKSGYRDLSKSLLGDWRSPPFLDPSPQDHPLGHSGVYFLSHDRSPPIFVDTSAIGLEIYDVVGMTTGATAPADAAPRRPSMFRRRPKQPS